MSKPGVALQLYTLRELTKGDFVGTLRQVVAAGYNAVELAGLGGLTAAELRTVLDELGLTVAGAHVGLALLETALEQAVADQAALGNTNVVCPVLPADRRQDEAAYHRFAEQLNAIGRRCAELGARFIYHNHAFEFEPFGAGTGMEILLEETDPALVGWEPDVYWIAFAKQEPAAWLTRYANRCRLIHLKDMTSGQEPTYAEVGEGILDFRPIFAATAGAEWYIVEQDLCQRPPLESIAISRRHLREWGW